MDWMLMPLRRYFEFHGRSRRMEFWMFQLFQVILILALLALVVFYGQFDQGSGGAEKILGLLLVMLSLGLIIPNVAVIVRRLHDQGKSGWWYLISFIPLGGIILFFFMCSEGDIGENEYGPDPKDPGQTSIFE